MGNNTGLTVALDLLIEYLLDQETTGGTSGSEPRYALAYCDVSDSRVPPAEFQAESPARGKSRTTRK